MRLYRVSTYDGWLDEFTPQEGIAPQPCTWRELRRILRELQSMGYIARRGDPYTLVEAVPSEERTRGA